MSFITQCPACETAFKVAPEQLKVSEGWVRCGHCQHVFDASLNLQPWWPEPPEPPEPDATEQTVQAPSPTEAPDLSPLPEPVLDANEVQATEGTDASQEWVSLAASDTPIRPAALPATPVVIPLFMKRAMQKAYWQQTPVKLTLLTVVVLLALALVVQWTHQHRNEWAARYPAVKPALQTWCQLIGCQVQTPRQLTQVMIESSSFMRQGGDQFQFQLVMRNRADMAVAMPHVELSLTDIDSRVLARKMVAPTDWPGQPETLGAMAEWTVDLQVQLDIPPDWVVTGYQAELFYP